jgi:hypothetical protein
MAMWQCCLFLLATLTATTIYAVDPKRGDPKGGYGVTENSPTFADYLKAYSPPATYSKTFAPGFTFISPPNLARVTSRLIRVSKELRLEYESMLGNLEGLHTSILLLNPSDFYKKTKAPNWTNAIYFQERILIPLESRFTFASLSRTLRHEYLHAVTHHLSNGELPGWLDEGIAQWIEGYENPNLKPALDKWLRFNQLLPLATLSSGFTSFNAEVVPVAYAQSLKASKLFLRRFGFQALARLMEELKSGVSFANSFLIATGSSFPEYEREFKITLQDRSDVH